MVLKRFFGWMRRDKPGQSAGQKEETPLPAFSLDAYSTKHSRGQSQQGSSYGNLVKSQRDLANPSEQNPLPTDVAPPIAALAGNIGERHVLVFMGHPHVGKQSTATRLLRYLSYFHGATCKRFDVCEYDPPEAGPPRSRRPTDSPGVSPGVSRASSLGNKPSQADQLLADLKEFLLGSEKDTMLNMKYSVENEVDDPRKKHVDSGRVAILFASNCEQVLHNNWSGASKEGRRAIYDSLQALGIRVKVIFVEIICTNAAMQAENLRQLSESAAEEVTAEQYEQKVRKYVRAYVSVQRDGSEDDLSYMKMINYGEKVITNKMHGYLPMRIVQFLSNIHTHKHVIYLTRHGQSEYNVLGKLGGNPGLSAQGQMYAERLGKFAAEHICQEGGDIAGEVVPARLWTSSLQRTINTARHIAHPVINNGLWEQMSNRVYRNLDEIFAGEYEGMTVEEIQQIAGDEAAMRKVDKIGYRYPRGESYFDLIARLDPLVHEMESYKEPLLIISHQAVLRVVYSYLMDLSRETAPKREIPLHTVMKVTFGGVMSAPIEERFYLGPEVVAAATPH
eukprot:CAMPEP_0118924340 /NCGR_PEP_ID=MMETSP1169-20130426/2516_1 /TAXON_ID=36882 /ORGANISM="Pyramimonas obovata, Strain CCMP722" /LENGTH=561 /DNA_ID=CAMNT_0006865441 /DNA_START=290 /DNA_END=1975 /DNA_ORIENTATION=-